MNKQEWLDLADDIRKGRDEEIHHGRITDFQCDMAYAVMQLLRAEAEKAVKE